MAQQRPAEREVTCVKKHPQADRHKGITHLGGKGWQMTRWQVTAAINSGGETFFTQVNGKRAVLQVVDDPDAAYVRAVFNDQWTDDLLALPECVAVKSPVDASQTRSREGGRGNGR